MTRFASLKKNKLSKTVIVKGNLELSDLGFLYYSAKGMPLIVRVYPAVFNFQSMKSPVELNRIVFSQNSFVISPGLLYHMIRRNTGRLPNEAFTSNPIASWKQ